MVDVTDGRKGQISTYIKPIIVLVFTLLMVILVANFVDFQTGLEAEQSEITFRESIRQDYQAITDCLQANTEGSGQLLNFSKLVRFEKMYRNREPPCAEDFNYGYNVTVQERFIHKNLVVTPKIDMVFVVDMSESITTDELEQICDVQDRVIDELESRGFSVEFTVFGLRQTAADSCVNRVLDQSNTNGTVDHNEDWGPGTAWVAENFDWRENATKILFPITDECPEDGGPLYTASYDETGDDWGVYNTEKGDDGPFYEERGSCGREEGDADRESVDSAIDTANAKGISVFPLVGDTSGPPWLEGFYEENPDHVYFPYNPPSQNTSWEGHLWFTNRIAQQTGGRNFSIDSADSAISELVQIAVQNSFFIVDRDNTCAYSEINLGRKAELVLNIDASLGYGDEWGTVCQTLADVRRGLELRGWNVNTTIYGPGQPGEPTNGQGQPMEIPDGLGSGTYDYRDSNRNVPSCLEEQDYAASSRHGKAITSWTEAQSAHPASIPSYDTSKDYGLEGWGVSSQWILDNHPWNQQADKRVLVTLANQDPTGTGPDTSTFRTSPPRGNETNVSNSVVQTAQTENVKITLLNDGQREITGGKIRPIMEQVAEETGGQYAEYGYTPQIPSAIRDSITDAGESGRICPDHEFRFGEQQGSTGSGLDQTVTIGFPVTIRHEKDLVTPGLLHLQLRQGDLETLAGLINRVVQIGQRDDRNVTREAQINTETRLFSQGDKTIQRPTTTDYQLTDPTDGGVDVNEDLVIGVNGRKVFEDQDNEPSTITGEFQGYEGASLQLFGLNKRHPNLSLSPTGITCSGCSTQVLTANERSASLNDDPDRYQDFGGLGIFHSNFTSLNIGQSEPSQESVVCAAEDRCVVLRADGINQFELEPGEYTLRISYNQNTNTVEVER